VVNPHKRRATQQAAWPHRSRPSMAYAAFGLLPSAAARLGFALEARLSSLRSLQMITDIRRVACLADGPQDAKCG